MRSRRFPRTYLISEVAYSCRNKLEFDKTIEGDGPKQEDLSKRTLNELFGAGRGLKTSVANV